MKKRITILNTLVLIFLIMAGLAENIRAEPLCPGPYDHYGEMLDQVACKDANGNPTGQEKMDCVTQFECCCNTSKQTPCDAPE